MALSNTAVPKYYGQFREAVLRGDIPVNKMIEMEMNRIDDLIRDPSIYYDDTVLNGWIQFCEEEMTLTDGGDVTLVESFKLWAEQLLGWYYFIEKSVYVPNEHGHGGHYVRKRIKKRLINKQFIIVGRSGAKSLYDSFMQEYFHVIDTTTTHQIVTAPTMRQADEIIAPITTAITRSKGPLFQFLTEGSLQNTTGSKANRKKLAPTKKGIENFMTNSLIEVRPMSIPKLQGLRVKVATVDEWLSCDIREDPIGAIEQGAAKIDDYVIIATSSEGTIRNGPGDTIKLELLDILKGEYNAPHVSIWWYRLDDVSEVGNPELWLKANPNLGVTVSYETYQAEVERAEKVPAARNDILAKRFGIPTEGYTYFFAYEDTLVHRKRHFWRMTCAMGVDLSRGDDFCAFTFLFPIGNGEDRMFGVKTISYVSEISYKRIQPAMRMKYDEFIEEGSLIVMENCAVLDMMDVYDDINKHIEDRGYNVACVGYDPYNAQEFIQKWEQENGSFGIMKVIQGSRTESVPLGELKILAEERKLLFDQAIMQFSMGNAITIEDTNGNRKLLKKRHDQKIDNVAALMDAYVAYKANRDLFD